MKIALVIFIVMVAAVLLLMYRRKKQAAEGSPVESAQAQTISSEPEAQQESLTIETSNVAEVVSDEVIEGLGSVSSVPEDAVLKRHFIQQLTAEIEATMPERPSDSTLKRHYDTQLSSSVVSKLDALK